MRALFLALLAILVMAGGKTASWKTPPAFCNQLDCPHFTTKASCKGFHIREYPAADWVGSSFEGPSASDLDVFRVKGFENGFAYISGANVANIEIPMAAPVLYKIVPGSGPACNTTFTVSFFIPFMFQGEAPQPTARGVSVTRQQKLQVAVHSFGGFARTWDNNWAPELMKLGNALQKRGVGFSQAEEWGAVYNSPFQPFNRHNEVWLRTNLTDSELQTLNSNC